MEMCGFGGHELSVAKARCCKGRKRLTGRVAAVAKTDAAVKRKQRLRLVFYVRAREEGVQDDKNGANGNGGIGNVESGPGIEDLPGKGVEIYHQEIGDGAVDDAVGEVSGGTAKKEGESGGVERGGVATGDQEPGDQGDDYDRTGDEQDADQQGWRGRKKAESDA